VVRSISFLFGSPQESDIMSTAEVTAAALTGLEKPLYITATCVVALFGIQTLQAEAEHEPLGIWSSAGFPELVIQGGFQFASAKPQPLAAGIYLNEPGDLLSLASVDFAMADFSSISNSIPEPVSDPPDALWPPDSASANTNVISSVQPHSNPDWLEAMRQARASTLSSPTARHEMQMRAQMDAYQPRAAHARLEISQHGKEGFDLRLSRLWTAFADGEPFFSFDVPGEKLDRTRLTCERKDYLEVHGMIGRLGLQCRF
jgi:hypothetical protein